ncbi:toll-like receptor 21 [Aplochiton taeniatus]
MLPEDIFSKASKLITLILRQNNLSNFTGIAKAVTNLKSLTKLDLCYNNLTSIKHSNTTSLPKSLTTLYLCRNNLATLGCETWFLSQIILLDLSYNTHLPSMDFQNVDLRNVNYMCLRSTNVTVPALLNLSNVRASHVDFSDMGLNDENKLKQFCQLLRSKVKSTQKLRLASNKIVSLKSHDTLPNCPLIKGSLDLSYNRLKNISCLSFIRGQTSLQNFSIEHNLLTSINSCEKSKLVFPNIKVMSFRYNRIISVYRFAFHQTPNITTLKLNINTIAYLDRKALKGLFNLVTLRLDNNLLTDLFSDSFEDLHKLQTLNLRNNRISVIFNSTFKNLHHLETLDLGGNKITQFQPAAFDGLTSVSKLYLDGNNLKQINSIKFSVFQDTLQVLDLQRNQIRFLSEVPNSPFINLSKVYDLKLDGQMPYGITLLPRAFFRGLSSLKSLYITNNHITHLAADAFDDLTNLQFLTLDNSATGVVQLQPGVFKNLCNLTKLIAENMGIQNLSEEVFGNLTKLRTLQLNRNVMEKIDVNVLEALPSLRYLDIRNTPLSCTCLNSELQNWTLKNNRVQIVYMYNLKCPNLPNHMFHNFDTNVCYVDLGEYLFITTSLVVFLFSVSPVLYVMLYWKMKYSYYVFRSWFGEHWRRLREEEENCKYDAFISYNSSDEHWVLDQLLPNLEGNGSAFKLCLHHRDFELGRAVVDNIVSAVYGSRKTICVVSRSFLRSEWCSMEIQLASYRLFHELRDVLLLVFLEPIPERELSAYHRMRKVMLKKTYLQWPGTDCSDPVQAQNLFWDQLKRALRSGRLQEVEDNESLDNHIVADIGGIGGQG